MGSRVSFPCSRCGALDVGGNTAHLCAPGKRKPSGEDSLRGIAEGAKRVLIAAAKDRVVEAAKAWRSARGAQASANAVVEITLAVDMLIEAEGGRRG